jgi:hypothetical protein
MSGLATKGSIFYFWVELVDDTLKGTGISLNVFLIWIIYSKYLSWGLMDIFACLPFPKSKSSALDCVKFYWILSAPYLSAEFFASGHFIKQA